MISVLISRVMQECGLKQKDLAVVLDVPLQRVKRLAGGEVQKLTPDETRRLVNTLNLSAHWLATGDGPMFNTAGGELMGELMGELKTELKLCSQRVAQLGLKDTVAMAVRDIAYGVNTGQLEVVNGGVALLTPNADEQELLKLFRDASLTAKAAAIGALQGAAAASGNKAKVKNSFFSFAIGGNAGGKKE